MCNDNEIWKSIKNYEESYEVSNLGRVRNLKTGLILSSWLDAKDYAYVGLYKNGINTQYSVHSLVLIAFVGDRPLGCDGDHSNKNRYDNRLSNLSWKPITFNRAEGGFSLKGVSKNKGKKNPSSFLTSQQVREIFKLKGKEYQRVTASRYGVDQSTISDIQSGVDWKNLNLHQDKVFGTEEN